MTEAELEKMFSDHGYWVTQFKYDNKLYGGVYKAYEDIRITQFRQCLNEINCDRILELGSLEGGHSVQLADFTKFLTAIEARKENVNKSKFIANLYKKYNIEFINDDVNQIQHFNLAKFDAIFCCGILYHLTKPWETIRKLSNLSDKVFVWTHYVDGGSKIINFQHKLYLGEEFEDGSLPIATDGLEQGSFRFDLKSLKNIFIDNGYKNIKIIRDQVDHPAGPAITLFANKE